jgi:hypothetical protein
VFLVMAWLGAAAVPERFWAKVDKRGPEECWVWTGARSKLGYGKVRSGRLLIAAHRIALLHSGVEIPAGMFVLHSCDNRPCCNPSHLRVGTKKDNAIDRALRNPDSWAMGSRNAAARLTAEDVLSIRERLAGGEYGAALAREYSVAQTTISAINRRSTWARL